MGTSQADIIYLMEKSGISDFTYFELSDIRHDAPVDISSEVRQLLPPVMMAMGVSAPSSGVTTLKHAASHSKPGSIRQKPPRIEAKPAQPAPVIPPPQPPSPAASDPPIADLFQRISRPLPSQPPSPATGEDGLNSLFRRLR